MPGVELKASVRDGFVVVVLRGDLDATGAADAEAAIAALVAPGQTLIIDISALDFLDCASLRALLRVQTLARRGGGDVVLAAPQPHVLRLFGPDRQRCGVLRSGQPRGCRRGYWQPQHTVPLAAACGACCTP